jgi:hypothetical protein
MYTFLYEVKVYNVTVIKNKIERRIKEENNTIKIDDKQNKIMRLVLKML